MVEEYTSVLLCYVYMCVREGNRNSKKENQSVGDENICDRNIRMLNT